MSTETRRAGERVSTTGRFFSVLAAFDGTPEGLAHALKVEISPVSGVTRDGGAPLQTFGPATQTDRALLDFGAVDPDAIDFAYVERDCEILVHALREHPDVVRQALGIVCSGAVTEEQINASAEALAKIRLTEQGVREQGGGFVAVALVVVAVLLCGGCFAHCPPPEPQVPHP